MANLGGNELLDGVPGLDEAVRAFMLNTLKNTYSTLEAKDKRGDKGLVPCPGMPPLPPPYTPTPTTRDNRRHSSHLLGFQE